MKTKFGRGTWKLWTIAMSPETQRFQRNVVGPSHLKFPTTNMDYANWLRQAKWTTWLREDSSLTLLRIREIAFLSKDRRFPNERCF